MAKEGSPKIVDFMTPVAGALVLGRGQISHVVKISFRNVCLHELSFLQEGIYKLPVKVYTLPNTNTYSVFRLFSWLL